MMPSFAVGMTMLPFSEIDQETFVAEVSPLFFKIASTPTPPRILISINGFTGIPKDDQSLTAP